MFDFTTEIFIDKIGFIYPLSNDINQPLLLEAFNQIRLNPQGQVVSLDRLQVDELHRHIRHEIRWLLDVLRLSLSGNDVDLAFRSVVKADALRDGPVLVGVPTSETQKLQALIFQ